MSTIKHLSQAETMLKEYPLSVSFSFPYGSWSNGENLLKEWYDSTNAYLNSCGLVENTDYMILRQLSLFNSYVKIGFKNKEYATMFKMVFGENSLKF